MASNQLAIEQRPKRISLIGLAEKGIEVLGNGGAIVAGVSLLAMMLVISTASISRYLFSKPWNLCEELSGGLLLVMFFMALLYVLVLGKHIRINLVSDRLPAKLRTYLLLINSLLAAVYAGFVFYQGVGLTNELIEYNVRFLTLPMPEFIFAAFIPIGIGFFGLGCIVISIKQVSALLPRSIKGE